MIYLICRFGYSTDKQTNKKPKLVYRVAVAAQLKSQKVKQWTSSLSKKSRRTNIFVLAQQQFDCKKCTKKNNQHINQQADSHHQKQTEEKKPSNEFLNSSYCGSNRVV